jgi:transposase
MRFVAIKTTEQQDILLLHKARQLIVKERTAQANQIRGLLAEYGIIIPKGISHIHRLLVILDDNEGKLSELGREIFQDLYEQFKAVDAKEKQYQEKIQQLSIQNPVCRTLMKINGIGTLTASAITAKIGNINVFKSGREFAAYIGLVPTQHSSGNNIRLGGISKRGDRYLRTLLIHGSRAVVNGCEGKTDKLSQWVADKKQRRGYNKAVIAVANKNVRMIWAILTTGEDYRYPEQLAEVA